MVFDSHSSAPRPIARPHLYWVLSNNWELFKRSVIQIYRTPDQFVSGVILQPLLLLGSFAILFGGAITTGAANYLSFLLPGTLVMISIHISTVTAVSVANDMTGGIVDRFRSLPMMTSAIVGGTILSSAFRCLLGVGVIVLVGLMFGFQPHADLIAWSGSLGILLLLAYAFSWLFALIGLAAKSVEGAQQMAGLVWPLFFVSGIFVPVDTLPSWLQGFARNQPLTQSVDAVRALLLGQAVSNHIWIAIAWCIGIILVSIPLAGILFKRKFS